MNSEEVAELEEFIARHTNEDGQTADASRGFLF
jgi:hypothetical protein